jgi:hypothetical protein
LEAIPREEKDHCEGSSEKVKRSAEHTKDAPR